MDCQVMRQTCHKGIHFPITLAEHVPYYTIHGGDDAAPQFINYGNGR
jgi:hypothetical protein